MTSLAWCTGLVLAGMAQACASSGQEVWPENYWHGATRKLGRGVANVLSAPLELIRKPFLVGQQDGGLAGVTVGIVQGLGAAVIREGAGLIEVVTFFAPFPNHFQPLVKPEFIYAGGDWVP
jgi:putative exosortase-associated protein (TIGR04073 family)